MSESEPKVPKIVKVENSFFSEHIEYTEEYKNKNWVKCRYGKDLRDCLEYFSIMTTGSTFEIYCKLDNRPCSARWVGDMDE